MNIQLTFSNGGWVTTPKIHNGNRLQSSQALDYLWQHINRHQGTLMVGLNGSILYVTDSRLQIPNDEIPILFTGSPREIILQLRPYMLMMEGQ